MAAPGVIDKDRPANPVNKDLEKQSEDVAESALIHQSLASIANRLDDLFSCLRRATNSSKEVIPWDSFNHEFERFDLWADNLGLYHQGHSSLDWRLREAESLSDFVRNLLADLCSVVENC